MTIIPIIAAILLCGSAAAQNYSAADLDAAFNKTNLVISSSGHGCYQFETYVAANSEQRSRGLMFVRDLPEFTGMLFTYPRPAALSMWMKNTYIPLDILFFGADGDIANIVENTVPLSPDSISAARRVHFVLELNAGVTKKLGIDADSRVIFTELDSDED
jgi:uncharacterized membrane protein (UPF0127 family)